MKLRKSTYMFKGRTHSKFGIISMFIGIVSLIAFLTISFISGHAGGQGVIGLGAIGITCFIASIWGFQLGMKSLKEKDIYLAPPLIGFAVNGVMIVVLFILYLIGIVA